jgi:predicted RecB family endonuclease
MVEMEQMELNVHLEIVRLPDNLGQLVEVEVILIKKVVLLVVKEELVVAVKEEVDKIMLIRTKEVMLHFMEVEDEEERFHLPILIVNEVMDIKEL